jgi:hypothetical protein
VWEGVSDAAVCGLESYIGLQHYALTILLSMDLSYLPQGRRTLITGRFNDFKGGGIGIG